MPEQKRHFEACTLRDAHRRERQRFDAMLKRRQQSEAKERASRLRTGILGLWDRVRGEYKRIEARNAEDAKKAALRDREQRHSLLTSQHEQRRKLQAAIVKVRDDHRAKANELYRDLKQRGQASTVQQQAPAKNKADAGLRKQFNGTANETPSRKDRLARFKKQRQHTTDKHFPSRDRE